MNRKTGFVQEHQSNRTGRTAKLILFMPINCMAEIPSVLTETRLSIQIGSFVIFSHQNCGQKCASPTNKFLFFENMLDTVTHQRI
jgi:hypothetical protein